jgi:hypothetical protein
MFFRRFHVGPFGTLDSGTDIIGGTTDIEMLDDRLPQMWNSFLTCAASFSGSLMKLSTVVAWHCPSSARWDW